MKKYTFVLSNLKCGGCIDSVKQHISTIEGVKMIDANLESKTLEVESEEQSIDLIKNKLNQIGYPILIETTI